MAGTSPLDQDKPVLITRDTGKRSIVSLPGQPVIEVGISVEIIVCLPVLTDIPVFTFPVASIIKIDVRIRLVI